MTVFIKFISIILGGVISCGLMYAFILAPNLQRLVAVKSEMEAKRAELITLDRQLLAYQNAQQDLAAATAKDQILTLFKPKEELVGAVQNLERAAALSGTEHVLVISEPNPTTNVPNQTGPVVPNLAGLTEIPYRVTALNDYLGTIEFLQYLEHLPEFTEISKIDLSAETIDSDTGNAKIYTGRLFGSIDGVFFVKSSRP